MEEPVIPAGYRKLEPEEIIEANDLVNEQQGWRKVLGSVGSPVKNWPRRVFLRQGFEPIFAQRIVPAVVFAGLLPEKP